MAVRRSLIIATVAGAISPVATAATTPPPATTPPATAAPATAPIRLQAVSHAAENASTDSDTIDLEVTRNGSLAMTLTWSGGNEPYDVLIEPSKGEGRYESGIDETTLTVATEPDRGYCFEVFGSDGSESGNECVSNTVRDESR
jgi:hypothetical protein